MKVEKGMTGMGILALFTWTAGMKTKELAQMALLITFTLTGVCSQTLTLNLPDSPLPDSICDAGFAAGMEKFVISGTADTSTAASPAEWDGLVVNLEYADGSFPMCTIVKSLGCTTLMQHDCYCTGQSGQSYDFVFNLTALTGDSKRLVRAKWISSSFSEVFSTNNRTLLEINDPNPKPDTMEVNGDQQVLSSNSSDCNFGVNEGSTVSVKFCVGESAPSYDVTVEFEGSGVVSSNSNSQCVSGMFVPTSTQLPGNLTSKYTKTGGCYRQGEHACIITKRTPEDVTDCDDTCIIIICVTAGGIIVVVCIAAALFKKLKKKVFVMKPCEILQCLENEIEGRCSCHCGVIFEFNNIKMDNSKKACELLRGRNTDSNVRVSVAVQKNICGRNLCEIVSATAVVGLFTFKLGPNDNLEKLEERIRGLHNVTTSATCFSYKGKSIEDKKRVAKNFLQFTCLAPEAVEIKVIIHYEERGKTCFEIIDVVATSKSSSSEASTRDPAEKVQLESIRPRGKDGGHHRERELEEKEKNHRNKSRSPIEKPKQNQVEDGEA